MDLSGGISSNEDVASSNWSLASALPSSIPANFDLPVSAERRVGSVPQDLIMAQQDMRSMACQSMRNPAPERIPAHIR
jgi:hypothetical protein